jgi:enamine deaminase RidA (YjgF/YER057c/UK114 family)
MDRERVASGAAWESRYGYSRAIKTGDTVHVSGTTAVDDDGNVVGPGEPYEQTKHALSIVADALDDAGAGIDDVVRTRLFVTDIDDLDAIGRAHGEVFGDVRPAMTAVEIVALIDPELVVEIEAEARISE